ncbi:MAG TPA: hypothetical protein VMB66_03260, partial [Candidatus Acidoferrales bacterium]|nr:hypothetical protein [Candidatus Acidoferrales bacterium]
EVERKMLYFSETDWTLPDIDSVSDQFDRDYDQDDYEKKISGLVKHAYKEALRNSGDESEKWWSAIRLLGMQDHYILVMIRQAALRPRGDRLKLFGTAIVIAGHIRLLHLREHLSGKPIRARFREIHAVA